MRAYFFTNMYLSSIQQGIQPLHVISEMFVKYVGPDPGQEYFILDKWARDHKTVICLNAGYSEEIGILMRFFSHPDNPFPWASFNEGKDALDGALTSVGIILPEEIYNAAKNLRGPSLQTPVCDIYHDPEFQVWGEYKPSAWEREMAERLNNYGLAK